MARRKRKIDRETGKLADASLIVIASEDDKAVKQYFELFESVRVQFEVLNTEDGRSSPQSVLERIDAYKTEFQIGEEDEFWIVTDVDHWASPGHIKNLIDVLQKSRQKDVAVALSNPCFDLWLLLHFVDFPTTQFERCDDVGQAIRAAVGAYNKVRVFDLPITMDSVELAISRAEQNDPGSDVLEKDGTHVYRILEDMVNSKIITIR